jgi:hypothetical protein
MPPPLFLLTPHPGLWARRVKCEEACEFSVPGLRQSGNEYIILFVNGEGKALTGKTLRMLGIVDKNVDTDNLDCFHPLIFAGRQLLLSLIHNISSNPAG